MENGLSRGEIVACQLFCQMDMDYDGIIAKEEMHGFARTCVGDNPGQYTSVDSSIVPIQPELAL